MGKILLSVIHGSHLYGLSHGKSDLDIYVVREGSFRSKQTIDKGSDIIEHSLDSFLNQCARGVPQALESMFASDEHVLYNEIEHIRTAYVAYGYEVFNRYERTIYNFSLGDHKRRRHALRLAYNLSDLQKYGRFNPTLKFSQKMEMKSILSMPNEFYREIINSIAGRDVMKDLK